MPWPTRSTGRPAPEIAIVTSKESGGWLEQASMDAQRARIIESLKAADPGGKVAAWWPDTGHGDSPTVHTKLTVVDDRRAYLGSANLSNRSMGLDTEIGLVMDADEDPRLEETIAGLRRSLLAEHMDTTRAAVDRAEEAADGLIIPAVGGLRSGRPDPARARHLRPPPQRHHRPDQKISSTPNDPQT